VAASIVTLFLFLSYYYGKSILATFKKIYNCNYPNFIDEFLLPGVIGSIIFIGVNTYIYSFTIYIFLMPSFVILLTLLYKYKRYKKISITETISPTQDEKFNYKSDKNSTTDALKRMSFVSYLKDAVMKINAEGSFVIGLNGKWGEGKSTILHFLDEELKKEEDIITAKFNPWFCNTKEDIIKDFYNSIEKELKEKLIIFELPHMIRQCRNIAMASLKPFRLEDIAGTVISPMDASKNIGHLNKAIAKKLKAMHKKVVVIIDDLDRMEKTELLLVFKLIKICSDIDNFIYILSFDKEQVEAVFEEEKKKDSNYLEKIIQINIEIPTAQPSLICDYLKEAMGSLLHNYDSQMDSNERLKIEEDLKKISSVFTTLRTVKRYINILTFRFSIASGKVNLYDFFILETINFIFPEKYNEIFRKREYFLLSPRSTRVDPLNVEKEYENFFNETIPNLNVLHYLVEQVFPVTTYDESEKQYTLVYRYREDFGNYNRLEKRKAEDPLFFEIYFTLWDNKLVDKANEIKLYFENLSLNNTTNIESVFENTDSIEQTVILETFDYYIEEYLKESDVSIILSIMKHLYNLRNRFKYSKSYGTPYELSARIICELLLKLFNSQNEIEKLINVWDDIDYLDEINSCKRSDDSIEATILDTILSNSIQQKLEIWYLNSKKNIFDEKLTERSVENLFKYCDKEKVKNYIYKILESNPKYILNLLSNLSFIDGNSLFSLHYHPLRNAFDLHKIEEYIKKIEELEIALTEREKKLIKQFRDTFKKFDSEVAVTLNNE
jgi:Predicted P-loop ATPase